MKHTMFFVGIAFFFSIMTFGSEFEWGPRKNDLEIRFKQLPGAMPVTRIIFFEGGQRQKESIFEALSTYGINKKQILLHETRDLEIDKSTGALCLNANIGDALYYNDQVVTHNTNNDCLWHWIQQKEGVENKCLAFVGSYPQGSFEHIWGYQKTIHVYPTFAMQATIEKLLKKPLIPYLNKLQARDTSLPVRNVSLKIGIVVLCAVIIYKFGILRVYP